MHPQAAASAQDRIWMTVASPSLADAQSQVMSVIFIHKAAVLGVISHVCFFVHGEWHLEAPALLIAASVTPFVIFLLTCITTDADVAAYISLETVVQFGLGLSGSILTYRLLLHRLHAFPGPIAARVTKLWHMAQTIDGKNHELLGALHRKYGDFVRTGPNELTCFNVDALEAVGDTSKQCVKSPWYDFLLPEKALVTIRDRRLHDLRRRIWLRGFSRQYRSVYEEKTWHHARLLVQQISHISSEGQPVDVSDWFSWFAFDAVGDIGLSRSFDMLRSKENRNVITLLRKSMRVLGQLSSVIWLARIGFRLLPSIPAVAAFDRMRDWCKNQLREREMEASNLLDIMSAILTAAGNRKDLPEERSLLDGDVLSMIVAGSDTISYTLTMLFYELCRNPTHQEVLFDEVGHLQNLRDTTLQALPQLNATIKEILRLHPAVPTGGYRDTPKIGLRIGNTYVPGNVTLVVPRCIVSRSERYFRQGQDFIPERWTSAPEMIRDARAHQPFSLGRHACLGASLAMTEMRIVLTLIVQRFKFCAAVEADLCHFEDQSFDHFTMEPGRLNIFFEHR